MRNILDFHLRIRLVTNELSWAPFSTSFLQQKNMGNNRCGLSRKGHKVYEMVIVLVVLNDTGTRISGLI